MFKLVLGTIFGRPYPWDYGVRIRAVMINAYEILQKNILNKVENGDIRRLLRLNDEVELWIDSGGYQFLKHNVNISVEKIAKIYNKIDADYYVSLDHPPAPKDDPYNRRLKIEKTITNYNKLYKLLNPDKRIKLLPVYHLSDRILLQKQWESYWDTRYVAVGGLIPYIMQLGGKNSRLKALVFLSTLRKYTNQKIHALGIASPVIIPILQRIGIDSADTMTWRHKAAYGKVIIPGMGERHITGRKISFGPRYIKNDDWKKLARYLGEFNLILSENNGKNARVTIPDLTKSFEMRALFNAWSIMYISLKRHNDDFTVSSSFKKLYILAGEYTGKYDLEKLLELNDQILKNV